MHESSDLESYGEGHRTFDCPWCGAISGIDPSHIGEHFDCPECHKATKLTPQNTRTAEVTEPPQGETGEEGAKPPKPVAHDVSKWESYGRGHRTFDCPWCGAISGIDPTHLGESFTCPECHENTKLTPDNTRPGHVTEPPPDAPHHDEKPGRSPALLVVAVAIVAAIVGVLVATGDGGDGESDADGTEVAEAPDEVESGPGTEPGPGPGTVDPEQPPVAPGPGPDVEPQPPDEAPPVEPQPDEPDPEFLAQKAELEQKLETAKLEHAAAIQAIDDWKGSQEPELLDKLGLLEACNAMRLEADRLCQGYPGPNATQKQARAYNAVMREFVAADPKRVQAATRVTMQLNSERLKPRFLETWENVNFYLPYVRETMGAMEADGKCVESEVYGGLVRRLRSAEAELAEAEKALADLSAD